MSVAQQLESARNVRVSKPIDLTVTVIQIGQQVSDISITNIHNYKSSSARISDFRGKLFILDFWATWCSPCVAMIPRMDSLQKEFGGKVQFLSVTYQKENEVLPFLEKFEKQQGKHYDIPVISNDKELQKLFPHNTLPHYVWINRQGQVIAITGHQDVIRTNIEQALTGTLNVEWKKDPTIAYDDTKPLLIDGNGGNGSKLIYHSLLSGYIGGHHPGYSFTPPQDDSDRRITARNQTIPQLFRLAYGEGVNYYGWSRTVLDTGDSSKLKSGLTGRDYLRWLEAGHAFCYELIIPPNLSPQLFKIMQDDLQKLFPDYKAVVEQRLTKCLILKRTSDRFPFQSRDEETENNFSGAGCRMRNSTFKTFTTRLEVLYLQKYPYPIVDGTGYQGTVSMDINADLSNIEAINRELAQYDLKLVPGDFKTDILVIRDSKRNALNSISN